MTSRNLHVPGRRYARLWRHLTSERCAIITRLREILGSKAIRSVAAEFNKYEVDIYRLNIWALDRGYFGENGLELMADDLLKYQDRVKRIPRCKCGCGKRLSKRNSSGYAAKHRPDTLRMRAAKAGISHWGIAKRDRKAKGLCLRCAVPLTGKYAHCDECRYKNYKRLQLKWQRTRNSSCKLCGQSGHTTPTHDFHARFVKEYGYERDGILFASYRVLE